MSCPPALSLVLLGMPGMCRDVSRGYRISQRLEGWGHGRQRDDRWSQFFLASPPLIQKLSPTQISGTLIFGAHNGPLNFLPTFLKLAVRIL